MKTVSIIIIILFLVAAGLFGFLALKYVGGKISGPGDSSEPEEGVAGAEEENTLKEPPEPDNEDAEEEPLELSENIKTIEIYLDGEKGSGIFLGEAIYGISSKEPYMIYGQDFSEVGFVLAIDNKEYTFEPGSIHYLYIYTFIPKYGWSFSKQKVLIPGETGFDENIKLYIDKPGHNEIITEDVAANVNLVGWSADFNYSDNPGITRIEIYLNGPRDFGKFLGEADYGIKRPDVVTVVGNENYINSGFKFTFDASELEAGTSNTLYVYSYSTSGNYFLSMRDILMDGEKQGPDILISAEVALSNESLEISGWALNKNNILEGKPRDLDLEYSVKKIVFASTINGNEDIYSMNLDGSGLTQLTDQSGRDWYPAISPDGKKIAYTIEVDGTWQIAIMNWDGTDKVQLTTNRSRSGYPAWSFDGSFIFFEVYKDGEWEIYRIDSDGTDLERLTLNPSANDWHPYGHPFKYKVVYEAGPVGNEDLYIMDYDGNNIEKISDVNMRKRTPAISVDGKIIVFVSYEGKSRIITTMDGNGENITKLTATETDGSHPDISPDNAYITFEGDVSGQSEIFVMNLDGSNLTRLTNIAGDDWDPVFMYQLP